MLEVEVKYRARGPRRGGRRGSLGSGAVLAGERADADHYFNAPDRDFKQTDEAFRLRRDRRGELPHLQGAEARRRDQDAAGDRGAARPTATRPRPTPSGCWWPRLPAGGRGAQAAAGLPPGPRRRSRWRCASTTWTGSGRSWSWRSSPTEAHSRPRRRCARTRRRTRADRRQERRSYLGMLLAAEKRWPQRSTEGTK